VRIGTHARHDLLDPTGFIADDPGLGGLEVDRPSLGPLAKQRPVWPDAKRPAITMICVKPTHSKAASL
jgi:hypothetical protein